MPKRKKLKYQHIALFAEGEADTQEIVGTVFYKQVAKFGKWVNPIFPIEFMELDKEWGQAIIDNFNAGVIDRVPVPLDHTDSTEANTGEVIKLELQDDGIYAYLDIRRPNVVDDINNGLIFDVSISFDWDYIDTENGEHHGPTLLHVALVNNPYLKGMPEFEVASEGAFSEHFSKLTTALALPKSNSVIMLSESKIKELSEMDEATVKNDKAYAVEIKVTVDDDEVTRTLAPGEETTVPKDQAEAVNTQIADAVDPDAEQETEEEKKAREDQEEADRKKQEEEDAKLTDEEKQAKKDQEELSDLRKKNALSETEKAYTTLLSAGKITPAQKDAFMQLAESHSTTVSLSGKQVSLSSLVTQILEAGPKVTKFSESGSSKDGEGDPDKDEKKPSDNMSEAELRGMQATGADPKRADELAAKYPAMAAALANDSKENKKDEE